jgi:hypothetical protein
MAVPLDGGTGVFDRVGKVGRLVNLINRWCGNAGVTLAGSEITTDLPTELSALQVSGYDADMDVRRLFWDLSSSYAQLMSSSESLLSRVAQAMQSGLIGQVANDTPLVSNTLVVALTELIRQMRANGDYVTPSVVGSSLTAGSNTGNGTVVVSLKNRDGYTTENALAETVALTVSTASTTGTTRLRASGEAASASSLSADWPTGSGASRSLTAVPAGGSSDKLTNGAFDAFSPSNTPTGWTVDVGTIGTTILEEASTKFAGTKALKIAGNGSQLTGISQLLTGLSSRTPYAFNLWMRNSTNPAAGVLQVDLYDGSGIINDEAGNTNSFTVNLTSLGTSFTPKNFTFRLPEPVPATVRLRIHLTTAITNTHSLYLDHAAFQAATELYDQGPWLAAFSGSTEWSLDDTFALAITNDRAGKFQEIFERLFSMRAKGLLLPTTGSNLILDTLLD